MSSNFTSNDSTKNQSFSTSGPQHHIHTDNEPLPGTSSGAATIDYSPEAISHAELPSSEEGSASADKSHLLDSHGTHTAFPNQHKNPHQTGGTNLDPAHGTDRPATDFPKTPFNSKAQGIPTTHSSKHDTGVPSVDRFESKGIHTGSPTNKGTGDNTSTLPHHGFTTIGGTEPGSTTYKPSDDTTAPVHFQDSLAGQKTNWNDPDKLGKSSDGQHVPGQTSGVNLKKTTEDRSVPHPESHTRRPDEGVKFAEPTGQSHGTHYYAEKDTQKPSIGDKVLGKAEKVMGKIAGDTTLQEKGAARAQHGLSKN